MNYRTVYPRLRFEKSGRSWRCFSAYSTNTYLGRARFSEAGVWEWLQGARVRLTDTELCDIADFLKQLNEAGK